MFACDLGTNLAIGSKPVSGPERIVEHEIQFELARRVLDAAGDKPVAVLLTNGRPLALTDLEHVRMFGSEGDLEGWRLHTEFSEDGGKTWTER